MKLVQLDVGQEHVSSVSATAHPKAGAPASQNFFRHPYLHPNGLT